MDWGGGGGGWCRDGGSVSTENIFLNQVHEQPLSRLTVVLRVTVAVTLKTTVNLLAAWFYNMWHYIPVLIMGHATEVRTDANHLCLVPSGSKLPFFFFFFFLCGWWWGEVGCVCFFVCVFFFFWGGGLDHLHCPFMSSFRLQCLTYIAEQGLLAASK